MTVIDQVNTIRFGTSWMVAGCAALIVALGMTLIHGSEARARLERADAATSEQENTAFCRDVGVSPDSEAFARCTSGLNQIEHRYRARWQAEAAGLL